MLFRKSSSDPDTTQQLRELQVLVAAISKAQAVIEFELDGTIVTANDNFLKTMGYSLEEIRGRHHRLFVLPGYRGLPGILGKARAR